MQHTIYNTIETPYISAVIITFNEEQNIRRCLESLQGIVDEIVVVDSHSTDNTEDICSEFNVQFYERDFAGYSDTKNWGIEQCKHPFILSLDADEALDDELKKSILDLKPNLERKAYVMSRKNFIGDKWLKYGGWYPDKKVRLFHKDAAQWDGKAVHESVAVNDKYATEQLAGNILHFSFSSLADHLLTINKYSAIRVENTITKGKSYSLFTSYVKSKYKTWKIIFLKRGFQDGPIGRKTAINSGLRHLIEYGIYKKRTSPAQESKNVCLFNTTPFWGGGEKWHFEAAKTLKSRGIPLKFLTHKKGELQKKVKAEGIDIPQIRTNNRSFLNPFKIRKIVKYFKTEQINTVIFNGSADLKLGGIAAFIAGVPNVIYRRGLASAPKGSHLNIFLFTSVVTQFIANSKSTFELLCKNTGLPGHKVKSNIIYNSVSAENYPSTVLKDRAGKLILGIASRLVNQKGIPYAIEVAEKLKKRKMRFELRIAGTGKLETELKQLVTKLDLGDVVKFVGFVEDISSFMYDLDIYICTSKFEGFGFSMAEAMLAQKPVVAFDTSSNPEVVQDQLTGVIVPAYDIELFSDQIIELAHYPELCHEYGTAGRAYVLEHFSKEKQDELLMGVLT